MSPPAYLKPSAKLMIQALVSGRVKDFKNKKNLIRGRPQLKSQTFSGTDRMHPLNQ